MRFTTLRSIVKRSSALAFFILLLLSAAFNPLAYAQTHEAAFRPWSGYWWPDTMGGLGTGLDYRGRPAPLEKYNLLTTGMTSGTALSAYLDTHYDPNAPGWYGLCAYWARAASYENIDILPSSENNIIFRVGDKKGLLTLAHNSDIGEFGHGTDPEVFHEWLLTYIKDQRKAFVADLWTGEEVWSYPIYKYDMGTSRSGNVESVWVVVYFADDAVPPDYRGTEVHAYRYTYDLFLNGDGAITGGQWTGASVNDHPELLSISLDVQTIFPGLDYPEVVRLAASRDDFLEKGSQIVEVGPGTYNLILLDEDAYTISTAPGDLLSIRVEKEPGSLRAIDAVVMDGNGAEVSHAVVSNGSPLDILMTSTTPPYVIRLTQDDYADPNVYVLKADVKRAYNQEIPSIAKGSAWVGFALTNPGDVAVDRVTMATRDGDGNPIQTLLGPLRLEAGEKRTFFFSDLPARPHELSASDSLTLTADGPVDLLNLTGEGDRFLTAFVQGNTRGTRLVIPDTAPPMTPGLRMFGGVRNESFEEAPVTLRLYSAGGVLQKEVLQPIAGRGSFAIEPGFYPFYTMPKGGWIEIVGEGAGLLSGFQYKADASGIETLFALPVGPGKKIVPHVPEPGYWKTSVTLINPNDQENPVKLHLALAGADGGGDLNIVLAPREKRVLEIQDQFGKFAGDPLYHSILEITGQYPLAGYFTYGTISGGDEASYPLLDDTRFKGTLSLPHYPGSDGYWWTGAVVCNPSTYAAVDVRIEPYDRDGNLLEGLVQSVNLDAGAYDVFEVASRFGESASRISFIKFRTEGDSGTIGGFYLYGDTGNRILSGANM